MNEFSIFDIKAHYKDKSNRKKRILETEFQPLIEKDEKLNEKQFKDREVLLAEISLIKLFLDDIDYIIEKYSLDKNNIAQNVDIRIDLNSFEIERLIEGMTIQTQYPWLKISKKI